MGYDVGDDVSVIGDDDEAGYSDVRILVENVLVIVSMVMIVFNFGIDGECVSSGSDSGGDGDEVMKGQLNRCFLSI